MHPDRLSDASRDELLDALVSSHAAAARESAVQMRLLAELRRREPDFDRGAGAVETAALGRRKGWHADAALDGGRRAELAHRALVAEVAAALRESEGVVAREFEEAERLVRTLPVTLAALADGRIGQRHARLIVEQSVGLGPHTLDTDPRQAEERLAAFEHAVVPLAVTTNPPAVRRRSRAVRERLLPESIEVRARRAAAERRVVLEDADDGMAWLHQYLPAEDAHAAYARLTRLAKRQVRGSGRTTAQARADVARDLLLGGSDAAVPGSDTIRPTVHVTVPVLTLLGRSDAPATLDGYGPIDADTARRLAARAPSFTRILTHPETGVVLSVGRDSYAVPADLKRLVRLRDGTCRFPGCGRRARDCELDHTTPWAEGGQTSHDNLAALCASHHHLKHETEWTVARGTDGNGRLEWTSPAGRNYATVPEPP